MVSKAVHDLDSHDIGIHFTVFCLLLMTTPWSSTVQIQFSVKWKKSPHRLLPTFYQLDFRSQGKKDPWLLFAMFLHLVITTSSVCASTFEVVSLIFFFFHFLQYMQNWGRLALGERFSQKRSISNTQNHKRRKVRESLFTF